MYRFYSALVLNLILVSSTFAAPVSKSTKPEDVQTEKDTQNGLPAAKTVDSDVEQLDSLAKNEIVPERPIIKEASPSKRQYSPSSYDNNVFSGTQQFPSFQQQKPQQFPATQQQQPQQQFPTFPQQQQQQQQQYPVPQEPTEQLFLQQQQQQQQPQQPQQQQQDNMLYPAGPEVDLSPRAVAEYLLVTSDFEGFDEALADLVKSGVLTLNEVIEYKDSVSFEYEELLRQMADTEAQYLQDLSRVQSMDYMNVPQQRPMGSNYPEYPLNQNSVDYPEMSLPAYQQAMRTSQMQRMLMEKQQALDGILDLVMNDYYSKPEEDEMATQDYLEPETAESPNYDMGDDELAQLMEYLQDTLSKEDGPAIIGDQTYVKQQSVGVMGHAIIDDNIAKELDSLPASKTDDVTADSDDVKEEETEDQSGDEEDKASNMTIEKVQESSS